MSPYRADGLCRNCVPPTRTVDAALRAWAQSETPAPPAALRDRILALV